MAKDELWHGIPCKDIPWFPTVDADTCIGCTLIRRNGLTLVSENKI